MAARLRVGRECEPRRYRPRSPFELLRQNADRDVSERLARMCARVLDAMASMSWSAEGPKAPQASRGQPKKTGPCLWAERIFFSLAVSTRAAALLRWSRWGECKWGRLCGGLSRPTLTVVSLERKHSNSVKSLATIRASPRGSRMEAASPLSMNKD